MRWTKPPKPKGFWTPLGWITYEEYRRRMDQLAEDGFVTINEGALKHRKKNAEVLDIDDEGPLGDPLGDVFGEIA